MVAVLGEGLREDLDVHRASGAAVGVRRPLGRRRAEEAQLALGPGDHRAHVVRIGEQEGHRRPADVVADAHVALGDHAVERSGDRRVGEVQPRPGDLERRLLDGDLLGGQGRFSALLSDLLCAEVRLVGLDRQAQLVELVARDDVGRVLLPRELTLGLIEGQLRALHLRRGLADCEGQADLRVLGLALRDDRLVEGGLQLARVEAHQHVPRGDPVALLHEQLGDHARGARDHLDLALRGRVHRGGDGAHHLLLQERSREDVRVAGALDPALEAALAARSGGHGSPRALPRRVVGPGRAARQGDGEGQAGEDAAGAGPRVFAPVVGVVHEEVVGSEGGSLASEARAGSGSGAAAGRLRVMRRSRPTAVSTSGDSPRTAQARQFRRGSPGADRRSRENGTSGGEKRL